MKRIALIAICSVAACATPFPYAFWRMDLENSKLIGAKPEDDKPLSRCALTNNEYQCMVTTIDDYTNFKSDYQTKTDRLIILEQRCGNGGQ